MEVQLEAPRGPTFHALEREDAGYFIGRLAAAPGTRYRYRLDGKDAFPDPCSRFQPEGPHGPSEVVDPRAFRWSDDRWQGLGRQGQVVYQLHVGAFTPEGTYRGLRARLPYLKELGVTVLQLMPLSTFPGRFNWGYDGVSLFAPCATYGAPDELRGLVDEAHRLGLGVMLDVVYNHLGPDGNYLHQYSDQYFTDRYPAEWGEPLNFDGPGAEHVRRFFLENVRHWVSEYHVDGFRFDATQNLFDQGPHHILRELADAARAAAGQRSVLLLAENEPQDVQLLTPPDGGTGAMDALLIDDLHHSVRVGSTGSAEAYRRDFAGSVQELVSCVLYNALYQGQWYSWQKKPRGSNLLGLPPERFVFYLQNHDQVANDLRGWRLHSLTGEPLTRALTTLLLLAPQTPMLFMGQEFFASAPFVYFVDHPPDLDQAVRKGRLEFLTQFDSAKFAVEREGHQVPWGEEAFQQSKLDWSETAGHSGALQLHRELIALRRSDPCFNGTAPRQIRGETIGPGALVIRYTAAGAEERLLVLNLGHTLWLERCPHPLLAPPGGAGWRPLLCSEETRFHGQGAAYPQLDGPWRLPGHCAMVLTSRQA